MTPSATGTPQNIPGLVFCVYYDEGGEDIAYHDTEAENQCSGKLNPADGSYLNESRRHEGLDISYTKKLNELDSPCNKPKKNSIEMRSSGARRGEKPPRSPS